MFPRAALGREGERGKEEGGRVVEGKKGKKIKKKEGRKKGGRLGKHGAGWGLGRERRSTAVKECGPPAPGRHRSPGKLC